METFLYEVVKIGKMNPTYEVVRINVADMNSHRKENNKFKSLGFFNDLKEARQVRKVFAESN